MVKLGKNKAHTQHIKINVSQGILRRFLNYSSNFVTKIMGLYNVLIALNGGYIEKYYKTNKKYYIQFQQVVFYSILFITYCALLV